MLMLMLYKYGIIADYAESLFQHHQISVLINANTNKDPVYELYMVGKYSL